MRSTAALLAAALLAGLSAAAAAQTVEDVSPRAGRSAASAITVPSQETGDISAESSGALHAEGSARRDRATLSDLRAGTSGSTQTR